MSKSTRRLVFFTFLVVLLTVPAEILLLRALAVPDQKEAVREWAMSLGPDRLPVEVARLQAYPVLYRRELLRAASPDLRAATLRAHFDAYLQSRPGLDVNTVSLIVTLRSMLTPEMFDNPTSAQKQELEGTATQVAALLGQEEALNLMGRFGPADGTFASFEPTAMYLTNKVRGLFVALTQGYECDCTMDQGCYSFGSSCNTQGVCSAGTGWPQCGYMGWTECTGVCLAGW
ncbi:MAG: bacteriocin fulvocin C-related protein [Acidobacteria bacterium]|nr:bacteriocin fulvocin C-related protein [Acidobacteriota bacterium]